MSLPFIFILGFTFKLMNKNISFKIVNEERKREREREREREKSRSLENLHI